MESIKKESSIYKQILKQYIETQDETSLYSAEQISKSFIKNSLLPEEIVNLHIQALMELYPDLSADFQHSMDFLLETMISYGLAHQQFQSLQERQSKLESEIAVAANMQNSLLATKKPQVEGLDIGVISVPASQMNGDYHHFIQGSDGSVGIALADVIGKGIPAALCMSMIKYSMESFPEESMSPKAILKNLNRVVEQNIDPSMFITMFYAQYTPAEKKLHYASAGHEPGYYFNSHDHTFHTMEAKGVVLGVSSTAEYAQHTLELQKGDMAILLTDGVTESRRGDDFIETEEVLEVIQQYAHLSAQEMVMKVYKYFERVQNFELKDDFSLIVLKRDV
ncbi:PP2C family protein-serine/threonine phosphatase [Oceanobacillus halotolerans]|uniref:PP2C family protein-serine/threonine phosphatase n=1 Tax=Oceanobacillus halotolerans TaxID=2663380 RepID=UPI0013DA3001|nr:PP2C family protein-serine/threonine phosphatase [Oceanobacillus halotolerans]